MIRLKELYCAESMLRCAPIIEERGPNVIRALRVVIEATQ